MTADELKALIRDVPDFPKPGILFRDVTTLIGHGKGFAAAVLGGMTSLPGAVCGAYLLGIIENLFGGYVSIEFKNVVAFAVIVVMLCFKPSGLFARHYVKKV